VIDDQRAPGDRLPEDITGYRLLYTLEIVVEDELSPYLLLTYPSYAPDGLTSKNLTEGCWTPPFLSHHVDPGLSTPLRVVSLRRLFNDFERDLASRQPVPRDPVPYGIRQLGWQIGARDPSFEHHGDFIEVKRSYRNPTLIFCYKIVRYSLRLHDDDPGLRDLADSEARRGHVFLPLDDLGSVLHTRHSERHERTEQWFLGKPLASNVSHIIRTPERLTALRERAIPLQQRHFRHEEEGLLCTADLAGYGTALRYAQEEMHGFGLRGEQMAGLLQSSVIRHFDVIFSQLGVSQVRTLGDGFMAAFPKRVFPRVADVVAALIGYWRRFVETLEQLNRDIRDPALAMGSRMALHFGEYQYGRIGLGRSFGPTFDGASVVEVARLEQGLALAVKGGREAGEGTGDSIEALRSQRHVLAISDAAYAQCAERLDDLSDHLVFHGRMPLDAKELQREARVYGLAIPMP
jgi:class 3 adenylate cyclase